MVYSSWFVATNIQTAEPKKINDYMAEIIKTALITGGSKGIGYGIADVLINQGIRVAITSRSADSADAAAAALNKIKPGYALGLVADVRNLASQDQSVAAVMQQWGRLDYVVANAGVGHFAPIQELTAEQWQETIDINLTGVFFTAKATLTALKATEGYFITIASLAGTNFFEKGVGLQRQQVWAGGLYAGHHARPPQRGHQSDDHYARLGGDLFRRPGTHRKRRLENSARRHRSARGRPHPNEPAHPAQQNRSAPHPAGW